MVDITFTVHAATLVPTNVTAEVNGEKISAVAEALEVELTTDRFGALRLQFTGTEKTEAEKVFKLGSVHTWSVE